MSYKRLGDYIIEKVEFNDGDKYKLLQGVSNNKYFQKAKTNIIGIDLSKYRVAHYNQFVFNRATTRNGDKISIALRKGESCIVSPSYRIFEVRDENVLHPDYLQMWFTRPEFDRYARFKSHGSAHEFFDMEEMCEVELPIPSIEEQRQIVAQYQSIAKKIKVNEQICEKLEATSQALYKHWFVDFEFPISDTEAPEVSGVASSTSVTAGYKSSGGKMIWNEELGKEIPEGWEVKAINSLCTIGSSKRIFESEYVSSGVTFYRGKEITLKKEGKTITDPYFISRDRFKDLVEKYGIPKNGDILMTAVGTIGSTYMVQDEEFYFKDGNVMWFKDFIISGVNFFLYDFMQSESFKDIISEITIGSTQSAITITTFGSQKILFSNEETLIIYRGKSENINLLIAQYKNQNLNLTQLQNLLLSRLAVEDEIEA